jgi:hypothetical protein
MEPLTTVAYIEGQLGRDLTTAEAERAAGAIASASARIRAYTKQSFDLIEDDVLVTSAVGSDLRLPQRPVVSVSRVRAVSSLHGADPVNIAGSWAFDGIDIVRVSPIDTDIWVNLPEWCGQADTFEVTYTHGYAEVPEIVNVVAADMVIRSLTSPSAVAGMVNERIGQYSYQLQQGAGAAGVVVKMTDDDRATLDGAGFRKRATTVQMRQA